LQRFLGLINYDRIFIEGLSTKALPLYKILEKEKQFEWTQEHEKTLNEIKKLWSESLELMIPDLNGNFELESDASDRGIGAVLRQNGKPVAYISRTLNNSEKNYSITDREILAGLWAMEKLACYLDGKTFTYVTDHKAIEELKKKSEFGSARINRWFERLERFNFIVKYKRGIEMVVSDALSRSVNIVEKGEDEQKMDRIKKIMIIHENLGHRKRIVENLKDNNIFISANELNKILYGASHVIKRIESIKRQRDLYVQLNQEKELVLT
jgi:hypothetical protein